MNAPQEKIVILDQPEGEAAPSEFDRLLQLQREYNPRDMLVDESMDKMLRLAEVMADGKTTVPKHLQGSIADCMAVITQAMQWNMNPFGVAQKTHLVNGTLGYEAQLVNAVVTSSGAIRGHFHYEHRGEGLNVECRAGAVLRGDDEITWNEWLSAASVQVKNSPLWKTNPKQQLAYLQIKNWSRLYAPSAILGVYTPDELEELGEAPKPRGPQRKSTATTAEQDLAKATHRPGEAGRLPVEGDKGPKADVAPAAAPAAAAATAPAAQGGISGGQVAYLRNKLKAAEIGEQTICDRFQVSSIELLTAEQFDLIKAELLAAG